MHAAAIAALFLAVALAYANSLDGALVMDSGMIVGANPMIRSAHWENIRFLLTHDYWEPMATGGLYRPATTLSYLFNYAVLGNATRPFGYHAVNIFLHLVCAALVYALAWRMTRRPWAAGFAAALFGVHPVATEAVTNVIGRADLLAATGILAGLTIHARAGASPSPAALAGIAAAGLLAAFAKENGLLLPAVLLVHDAIRGRAARESAACRARPAAALMAALRSVVWRSQAALVPVVALYGFARWWVWEHSPPPFALHPIDNPLVEADFVSARLTALKVIALQIRQLIFPLWLSADYSYDQIPVVSWPLDSWSDWQAPLAIVLLAACAAAAYRFRRHRDILFSVTLMFLAILPTSNLLTLIGTIMAERFLYLPLAAFALFAAAMANRVVTGAAPPRFAVAIAAIVLFALGVRTHLRNRDWQDDLSLWSSTVRTAPASAKAHHGYSIALFNSDPHRRNIDDVIAAAERAAAIRGDYVLPLIELGHRYIVKGDLLAPNAEERAEPDPLARPWYEKAEATLERALELVESDGRLFETRLRQRGKNPADFPPHGNVDALLNLALARVRLGKIDGAIDAYRGALRIQPLRPQTYVDLSAAFARRQKYDDSAVALFETLIMDPGNADVPGRLAAVYTALAVSGTVIADGPGRVRIHLEHPTVRAHRCRAYRELERTLLDARSPQHAARARSLAEREGCS